MKIIYFLIVLVIPNKLTAADLEVTVKGIRTAKGVLRVAIFDDPKECPFSQFQPQTSCTLL